MKPQAILIVTLAALAVIAALAPLGEGSSWPCCDNCGFCNRKLPPECTCLDVSTNGCHPECKSCTKIGDTYRCDDYLTNFCENTCAAA